VATQPVPQASFVVNATSRAGVASGEWFAGLGTDWSGRIGFTYTFAGDQGGDESDLVEFLGDTDHD